MRLTVLVGVGVAVPLLLAAVLIPVSDSAKAPPAIQILFDLGDGTYAWANETVSDPEATNATWLAVQRAGQTNGISISSTWFSDLGLAILDLGDRHSPAGFVGLYKWNTSAHAWGFTDTGISDLVVSDGDAIALYNAGYDSLTFAGRTPVPTPDDPLPVLEFREDLANSGTSASPAPDAYAVRWDRDTGTREIAATPAVAYGKVFVTTMTGLKALDVRNGNPIWSTVEAKGFSSPAVFDGSVIVGTSNGTVVRLNASDGHIQWETRLLERALFSGITSSPKVAFDSVFIGTFNESGGSGEVVSLFASNGTVAWRHPTGSVHYSSPAFASGTVYVGIMGTYNTTSQVTFDPPYGVLALDAAAGTERWSFPTSGPVAASPAIAGPRLIVPSKDGDVYAIDRTTGSLDWRVAEEAGVSSPAVWQETAFVGGGTFGGGGRVVALDAARGTEKWSFAPNGPVQSSLTYADGKVFFATNTAHGRVYALNATTGALVWSFEPNPAEYILGSPVIADGVVFAPSDNGHVYALEQAGLPHLGLIDVRVGDLGIVLVVIAAVAAAVFVGVRRSRHGP